MNKIKITIVLLFLLFLTGCNNNYQNEELKELIEQNSIMESSVLIIKEESVFQNDGVSSTQYSNGFSGVIFNKEGSKYFVLTAYHSVESFDGYLYVLLWNVPRYNDLDKNDKNGVGIYYESKPIATIEYTDVKYDLAILSFETDLDLPIIELSDVDPNYGDEVAVISNPENKERNHLSFGKITSRGHVPFGDEKDDLQYNVIEHNAYMGPGSSGSVLLNNELKIVGINLGGSTDIFGNFKKGKSMPVSRINEFINLFNNLLFVMS